MRRALPVLGCWLLVVLAVAAVPQTGATFTSGSTTTATVTAAPDWTPPTVSLTDPGSAVSGTATLSASAADDKGTVASVRIEYAVADSGAWQPVCTDPTAPYTCAWSTTGLADGSYDLRAIATDSAGLTAVSDTVTTRVINSAAVVLARIPDPTRGSITLRGDYINGGLTTAGIYFQYAVAGSGSWASVPGCGPELNVLRTTRTCTWDASTLTGEYDVRAVATVGLTTLTDTQLAILIDDTAPNVALTVPTAPLSGTVLLTATATDDDAGMATVSFQYRRTGTTTWSTCGVDVDDPWRCALDTTTLANASWDFQAVATDVVGNTRTTAVQSRTVDNTISSVSITAPQPGDLLRGTVTVAATASSTAGIASVTIQARPTGGTWTTLCTDTASPYACTWDTTAAANGSWDLQAVLKDGTGATLTSATVTATVDNAPLRGADVQVANASVSGLVATGDRITLTYSTVADLTTIKAGWTGASTPVTVTFEDKAIAGAPYTGYDWAAFSGANLGKLSLTQNYLRAKKAATFTATMTATTQTIAGQPATVVTVTLGSTTQSASLRTASGTGTTRWYPSTAVLTPAGMASSGAAAVESGTLDKDF